MVIATTAKLRALLEASDYGEGEAEIVATSALCTAGPDLARLVVTLTEALEGNLELCHWELADCIIDHCVDNRKALADVEELTL